MPSFPSTAATDAARRYRTRSPFPWAAALRLVRLWIARSRERRELATLTHRELRDIAATRYDVLMEARKPFWEG